jgi:hypothetical protein
METTNKQTGNYKANVLKTNELYKKQFESLGQVRSILILFAKDINLNSKFLTLLNRTKKDANEYKKLLEATKKTKKGKYNVFYTLQALHKLTK